MLKEILFGNKIRSILSNTDKMVEKLANAPVSDLKDIYKTTADMIVGVSANVFTPENIEAAGKIFLACQTSKQIKS